jgi:pimeloyl-ACP methyl ester carboxylesterase
MDLKGKYDEREAAGDTLALADHLGWKKFHLAGFSMTGMVVERLAVDAPDRIRCVVAVGPVSAAGIKMSAEERQFFVDVITNDDKCRELASRITGHRLSPQWQEVKLRLARDTRTREAARGYLDMWTLHDFSSECGKSDVPFLIIGCKWDQPKFLKDDLRRTFLKWHRRAELEMMECGHCPMQEMPVYLQTLMENFMKRHVA